MDTAPRGQRARRTCVECHRRKIKCDKNIPCSTCIKRGLADSCIRVEQKSITNRHGTAPTASDIEVQTNPALIQGLLNRVAQLEAIIEADNNPSGLNHVDYTRDRRFGAEADSTRIRQGFRLGSTPEATLESNWTASMPTTSAVAMTSPDSMLPPNADPSSNPDAAQVLEFLAWGRRKDQNFNDYPENHSGPRRHPTMQEQEQIQSTHFTLLEAIRTPQLDFLEIILPEKSKVEKMVDFHTQYLLWCHGSFIALTFDSEVKDFYSTYNANVRDSQVNLQWLALLFSVLCGSMTCASSQTVESWGFEISERPILSKQWYDATTLCLNLSNYLQSHTIYSVQAISSLTIAAHSLGFSNSQSVLLAAAIKIAQSLGLHRLGAEDEDMDMHDVRNRRNREAGRRLWCQLCTQDWFSIPFSECYSLNPIFSNTSKPLNCLDTDMLPLYQTSPTIVTYCNYLYDMALLISRLQDAMSKTSTLFTKYEQVLATDDQMRKLTTSYMPTFLSSNQPVTEKWPEYIPWARRSLSICGAHKIIMIHRKFLGLSFNNSAFSHSRRTCVTAAKTILKEVQDTSDENIPLLWIEQAFTVAAAITLCLDAMHRKPDELEFEEERVLVETSINYLKDFPLSMIATRGIKLLTFLQQQINAKSQVVRCYESSSTMMTDTNQAGQMLPPPLPRKKRRQGSTQIPTTESHQMNQYPTNFNISDSEIWNMLAEMLPPQTGFGDQHVFDEFFSDFNFDFSPSTSSA